MSAEPLPPVMYLDESGHTGPNLLDPNQPLLVVATVHLHDADVQALVERHFPEELAREREIKHSSLVKTERGQQKVAALMADLGRTPERVKIELVDKRFAMACKVIEYVVEPVVFNLGGDLRATRLNVGLATLLATTVPQLMGPPVLDGILNSFSALVQEPNGDTFHRLHQAISEPEWPMPLRWAQKMLLDPLLAQGVEGFAGISKNHLDLALTSAYKLMGFWSGMLGGPIALVYDATAHMARHPEYWEGLTRTEAGLGNYKFDGAVFSMSMDVTTRFCPSHEFRGLQLADVVAGAFRAFGEARMAGKVDDDEYALMLRGAVDLLARGGSVTGVEPDFRWYQRAEHYQNAALFDAMVEHSMREGLTPRWAKKPQA